MKKSYILLSLFILSILTLSGCNQKPDSTTLEDKNLMSTAVQGADKSEVIRFHATQQGWSCITVGEYALKTIQEKFPEEYKNGIIIFRDVNGELPQNRDMVLKYQAGGSSLFVNAIRDGKDNIQEDVTVWRLVSNETQFINYFENKLKTLLGK
jgi:hypothetical protein